MPTVECMGETFTVQSDISAWAFADFAEAMEKNSDGDKFSAGTILAMMKLLEDCVIPDEWDRFKALTRAKRASFDDLMQVIKDMTAARAERPTGRSSDSSGGPEDTGLKSVSSAADKALEDSALRPDQKLAVLRARGVA